jgi:hypothetical protein
MNGRKIVWHLFASAVVILGVGSSVREKERESVEKRNERGVL